MNAKDIKAALDWLKWADERLMERDGYSRVYVDTIQQCLEACLAEFRKADEVEALSVPIERPTQENKE